MRGDQLAWQWRILRTIESSKQGVTVARLAKEEGCHPRTIRRDLATIQDAGFPLYSEKDGHKSCWAFVEGYKFRLPVPFTFKPFKDYTQTFKKEKTGLSHRSLDKDGSLLMTIEVGGLREVMSWVMGFGFFLFRKDKQCSENS